METIVSSNDFLQLKSSSLGYGKSLLPHWVNSLECYNFYYARSDFIWDFWKLPFPTHLGKHFIKIGKIRAKIHEIGKIKAIFGLGMTPIYGLKSG